MKPNKEQAKKFWERFGFRRVNCPEPEIEWAYTHPDGGYYSFKGYPPIDLNNLFKYAVPKYIELDSSGDSPNNIDNAYRRLFERWLKRLHWDNWQDPALSLFWAIYKVIEQ